MRSIVFPLDLHNLKPIFKVQKAIFSLLNIYILFASHVFCQNLALQIKGDNAIETKVVDSLNYLKSHKDFLSISTEVDTIQKKLLKLGFIEHKLDTIHRMNDSTFIAKFQLKKKYDTIYIYYDKERLDKKILKLVSNDVFEDYFILKMNTVEEKLALLNYITASGGFPFSKLRLTDIKIKDDKNLSAQLEIITETQKRHINDIVIKGYDKFPKGYLKHYLKIKPLQVFDLTKIKSKTERLNDLRFANQIKSPEVLFSRDSTTLYIYIEKATSNSFDGFLGFGTNEDTNKLQFDGYLNLNLLNNLNYGESFKLLYKSDENDQKTFQTNLTLPYLFSSPMGLDLKLYIFKRDSSFTTVNQSAKINYQINSRNKVYTGITSTESNNLRSESTSTLISDFNANYIITGYEYAKPQPYNLLFPINSSFFFETGFGTRKTAIVSEKQTMLATEVLKIFNLNTRNSLFFKLSAEQITSNSYLENELLRFGGINSIRGFEENSLLASSFGVINTEYRFQLGNNMFVHSITDVSYFENKLTETKEKLFGYGFGFGILTKSGLLRLNYANGKSENQKFKLANSKVHLSLMATF